MPAAPFASAPSFLYSFAALKVFRGSPFFDSPFSSPNGRLSRHETTNFLPPIVLRVRASVGSVADGVREKTRGSHAGRADSRDILGEMDGVRGRCDASRRGSFQ